MSQEIYLKRLTYLNVVELVLLTSQSQQARETDPVLAAPYFHTNWRILVEMMEGECLPAARRVSFVGLESLFVVWV